MEQEEPNTGGEGQPRAEREEEGEEMAEISMAERYILVLLQCVPFDWWKWKRTLPELGLVFCG